MRNLLERIKPRTELPPQKQFVIYIRTLQWYRSRLKGIDAGSEPIHIKSKVIEDRFFPYPFYNKKKEIEALIKQGEISLYKQSKGHGKEKYLYKSLKAGTVNLALLDSKYDEEQLDDLHKLMRKHIMNVTLPKDSPRTDYFQWFLEFRHERPDLFFIVDDFAQRVHTPISNFKSEYRNNILLYEEETTSLDVQTMQPLLLGKILRSKIGENEFSKWIDNGDDIYIMLQKKAGLTTRDEGKKRFFEILFSAKNKELSQLFGKANWIEWINKYKTIVIEENPHSRLKPYSNLAWLLQNTEVKIMRKVWESLHENSIPFLSVHDEIIIRKRDEQQTLALTNAIFSQHFKFFKINKGKTDKVLENETISENEQIRRIETEIGEFENQISDISKAIFQSIEKIRERNEKNQRIRNEIANSEISEKAIFTNKELLKKYRLRIESS